jgi:Capsule assembly protein Wzi
MRDGAVARSMNETDRSEESAVMELPRGSSHGATRDERLTSSSQTFSRVSGFCLLFMCADALARGASPYLPLHLSPEIDRKIQRVLLLGDKPVMRRPLPAAVVLDALPKACARDRVLCDEVRDYLKRFMHRGKLTHLSVSAAVTDGDSSAVLPNEHGLPVDSSWETRAHGYWQPTDYLLIAAGAIARDDETIATDSMVSFGFDFAQLDVGFRDHWWSPLNDSSSLISTQAPTMPSITLSNYTPISRLGFSYEVFMAEMSRQEGIVFEGGTTSGRPRLAGLQAAIEPAEGYSLAVSRETQYGGGARGGDSLSDFFDALFTRTNEQDTGDGSAEQNRVASITSSILFQGRTPFAVHIEYAGEDNAYAGTYRLGATDLSLGIDLPSLWRNFDASVEVSEWQNAWYVHHLYPKGLTNRGNVSGHWFGDNRQFGDAIGGSSQMLRGGWRSPAGRYWQARYRTLRLDPAWRVAALPDIAYERMHIFSLSMATALSGRTVSAEIEIGRDVFGDSFGRLQASVDFADRWRGGSRSPYGEQTTSYSNTQLFADVGASYSSVLKILGVDIPNVETDWRANAHVGVGARRRVSERSDLGVRLEADHVDGHSLLSLRMLDYRFRLTRKIALNGFFGAGRYDVGLPAYGYYWGAGMQYLDVFPQWDVGVDVRHHDKLGRDKTLPEDPPSTPERTRLFFDVDGIALYFTRRW